MVTDILYSRLTGSVRHPGLHLCTSARPHSAPDELHAWSTMRTRLRFFRESALLCEGFFFPQRRGKKKSVKWFERCTVGRSKGGEEAGGADRRMKRKRCASVFRLEKRVVDLQRSDVFELVDELGEKHWGSPCDSAGEWSTVIISNVAGFLVIMPLLLSDKQHVYNILLAKL